VDACVAPGASVLIATATSDDEDEVPPFTDPAQPMHCRETGPDTPWLTPPDELETLEAPVAAGPGRYLWVRLELRGTTKNSPKVRALRVEHPGHDLLNRLPRAYSRDPAAAAFLHRYLGVADSVLADMQRRADARHVLLDPLAAPNGMLPWLAGLVGLTLDQRWSESGRRTMLDEAAGLFRKRGTKAGLERMIEIALGLRRPPVIVEQYRVRGLGGGMLGGDAASAWTTSVVGGGLRVGGTTGSGAGYGGRPLTGSTVSSMERAAHRFTVVIPALLDPAQERMVSDLLDVHRPAHTAYEICTVGAGMRVGRGLYVALTSIVGPSAGFDQFQVGGDSLGHDAVLGRPRDGIRPGASRVGRDTRVDG
jgi:phage tail-like protein